MLTINDIKNKFPEINVTENESMKLHTTFKIGGEARLFVKPKSIDEITGIIKLCKEANEKFEVIGRGSNLLVNDNGFDGVIICLGEDFSEIKVDGEIIEATAGVSIINLSTIARDEGLTGLEFACGIPGGIGGVVAMNAGAFGGEMRDVITHVTIFDEASGEVKEITNEEANFRYRGSGIIDNGYIVLGARFKLARGDKKEIEKKMQEILAERLAHQPLESACAGSTFKRPDGYIAAKLIDDAGLKGYKVGGAMVSPKHAGIIVNTGDATAKDVLTLCEHVSKVVEEKFGVTLEMEVKVI